MLYVCYFTHAGCFTFRPKIVSPAESPGITECPTSSLHGSNAPNLSSGNHMNFPLTHSNNNNNNSNDVVSKPMSRSPVGHSRIQSPVRDKATFFESKDNAKPTIKATKPKIDSDKLKIREDSDLTSESEAESPLAKGNFEKFSQRPPVKPKPRIAVKPWKQPLTDTKDKIAEFHNVRRSNSKPKTVPRPLSQNYPVIRYSNDPTSDLSPFSVENKKAPPPVARKSSIVRSASVSIKRDNKYGNDFERRDKPNVASTESKVRVFAQKFEGATLVYATNNPTHNTNYKPTKARPKPHARQTLSNNEGSIDNGNVAVANQSYGLVDASETENKSARNRAKSTGGYANTDFPNENEHKISQSYVNHVLHPENSRGVEARNYVNASVTSSKYAESNEREYVNDPGNGHSKDSHGFVQTTSNKGQVCFIWCASVRVSFL